MTAIFLVATLLMAQSSPPGLDQIRAEQNLEHRARLAIDFAVAAERSAEAAYSRGDMAAVTAELANMVKGVELADQSLRQTGKSPMRHPGPYKFGELRTAEMLVRLRDLEHRMEPDEREVVKAPGARVEEIHDAWFDGIMSKKK